jgi:hypothetical protein
MKTSITVKGDIAKIVDGERTHAAKSLTEAFRDGGEKLKARGRASIASGGFSARWQNAFRVNVYPKNGVSGSPKIFAYHKIKYAGQFEDPQPVTGKPLLWLPITKNLPGGQRWTPDKYVKQIGPLRSGKAGGKRLLFGQISVNRSSKPVRLRRKGGLSGTAVGKVWLPVFVGMSSVNDPKRFDITAQAEKTATELSGLFSQKWNSDG